MEAKSWLEVWTTQRTNYAKRRTELLQSAFNANRSDMLITVRTRQYQVFIVITNKKQQIIFLHPLIWSSKTRETPVSPSKVGNLSRRRQLLHWLEPGNHNYARHSAQNGADAVQCACSALYCSTTITGKPRPAFRNIHSHMQQYLLCGTFITFNQSSMLS